MSQACDTTTLSGTSWAMSTSPAMSYTNTRPGGCPEDLSEQIMLRRVPVALSLHDSTIPIRDPLDRARRRGWLRDERKGEAELI